MPSIVQTIVSQQVAPKPPTLQSNCAAVSMGGTILTPGTTAYLTQLSDLTALLRDSEPIATLTWTGGEVTVTTTDPHGIPNGTSFEATIVGASPAGYDGTFWATVTGASSFTYPLASNPGTETSPGFWSVAQQVDLTQMVETWFGQGFLMGLSVLELGIGTPTQAIAALSTYIANNPNSQYTPGATGFFYKYIVPRAFDWAPNDPGARTHWLALLSQYEGLSAMTYFDVTANLSTYALGYTSAMKCAVVEVESPAMGQWVQQQITALSQSGIVVTVTTAANHGVSVDQWFQLQGNTPIGYNGWWQAQVGTADATLVFYSPYASPGAIATMGFLEANAASNGGTFSTEFSVAATAYDVISNKPSSSNKVPPLAFDFQYGVTPWPQQGVNPILTALENANVNYVQLGSEGGISTACIFWGTTLDGNDFLYWYSVDAAQLYSNENLANAVINGSNNKLNPLYYSQAGINRLQQVVYRTMNTLAAWGLANGTQIVMTQFPATSAPGSNQMSWTDALDSGAYDGMIVVNAEPYLPYLTENPDDYAIGRYAGLSVQYIPSRGFRSVILNLLVTNLITTP